MKKSRAAILAAITMAAMAVATVPANAGDRATVAQATPVTPVVGTFEIGGEKFRVKFTSKSDIERARTVLAGKDEFNPFPSGTIVYGSPDVNVGYSWHLEPAYWSEVSTEVCDGVPSDVEKHRVTSPYYCPWGAKLIELQ